MVNKLIEKGYKVVLSGINYDMDCNGQPVEVSLNDRKIVIVAEHGFAAIDSRGRYFEGGSHPPQTFKALELARWREKRQKEGPLPLKVE